MRNPTFNKVLAEMAALHERKNSDYAAEGNPYSNFEEAAALAGVSEDRMFLGLIGIKSQRLHQLVAGEKVHNFESVEDSILDLANYAAIWLAYRRDMRERAKSDSLGWQLSYEFGF